MVGSSTEPDLVRCYYCGREIEGWEPEEDGLNCKDVDECSDGTHQCQIIGMTHSL